MTGPAEPELEPARAELSAPAGVPADAPAQASAVAMSADVARPADASVAADPAAGPADRAVVAAPATGPAAGSALAHAAVPSDASGPGDVTGDASLLALVDRLAGLLERSDLLELEVEAGATGLILRKPAALVTTTIAPPAAEAGQRGDGTRAQRSSAGMSGGTGGASGDGSQAAPAADARVAVRAPLTGIFYSAPGPGSPPYVAVGREVVVGQVIGLIEAMKLFNEIKSDQAGRVLRVIAEDGALVKAKQPLIEVGPL